MKSMSYIDMENEMKPVKSYTHSSHSELIISCFPQLIAIFNYITMKC